MKTITLRVEDCNQVVIDDLMDSYHLSNQFDRDENESNGEKLCLLVLA